MRDLSVALSEIDLKSSDALFNSQTEEFLTFKHEFGNPHSLIADHIYCIKEMNDGTLWIGADIGGISILDLHNITFMNPKSVKFTNISASNDEIDTPVIKRR